MDYGYCATALGCAPQFSPMYLRAHFCPLLRINLPFTQYTIPSEPTSKHTYRSTECIGQWIIDCQILRLSAISIRNTLNILENTSSEELYPNLAILISHYSLYNGSPWITLTLQRLPHIFVMASYKRERSAKPSLVTTISTTLSPTVMKLNAFFR